jgi:hypothetical protein
LVVIVAVPPTNWIAPNPVEPLLKVTVPVGVVLPDTGATLAVKVTPAPAFACADDTVKVVFVCVIGWKFAVTD